MRLSLLVADGVHAGDVICVAGVSLLVGRGPQCHVRPNSPAVSQRHCLLLIRDERVFLRDLGSKTGTFLNDRQLRGEIELQDGDMIQVGPLSFVVQFHTEDTEDTEDAAPPPMRRQAPRAPAAEPSMDEMVDLTRVDDDEPVSSRAVTQVLPHLEPYPDEPETNGYQPVEDDYAAVASAPALPLPTPAPAGHAPPPVVSRRRLTRISRNGMTRKPPT